MIKVLRFCEVSKINNCKIQNSIEIQIFMMYSNVVFKNNLPEGSYDCGVHLDAYPRNEPVA